MFICTIGQNRKVFVYFHLMSSILVCSIVNQDSESIVMHNKPQQIVGFWSNAPYMSFDSFYL